MTSFTWHPSTPAQHLPEEIHVEFFKLGVSEGVGKVVAIFEVLNINVRALLVGKDALDAFDCPKLLPELPAVDMCFWPEDENDGSVGLGHRIKASCSSCVKLK